MEETNFLIPKHKKLSESQINSLLKEYSLESVSKLPKIKSNDPALAELGVEIGDVIEIIRTSFAGKTKYYRVVTE